MAVKEEWNWVKVKKMQDLEDRRKRILQWQRAELQGQPQEGVFFQDKLPQVQSIPCRKKDRERRKKALW